MTIHRTTAELDAGPVAAQRAFPIGADDDAGAVYAESRRSSRPSSWTGVLAAPDFDPQPEDGATYAEQV